VGLNHCASVVNILSVTVIFVQRLLYCCCDFPIDHDTDHDTVCVRLSVTDY